MSGEEGAAVQGELDAGRVGDGLAQQRQEAAGGARGVSVIAVRPHVTRAVHHLREEGTSREERGK